MNQVRYQLSLLDPVSHYYQVRIEFTPWSSAPIELQLPAWIPGSYMIRDFARNVQRFQATDSQGALSWQQLNKQLWQVNHQGLPVRIEYLVYAFDLSVRANYFNDEVAVINPAACCLEVIGAAQLELELIAPSAYPDWRVATGLSRDANTAFASFGLYHAEHYQHLIDCPLLCGNLCIETFMLDAVPHHVVVVGAYQQDMTRFSQELQRICAAQRDVFGELPDDLSEYWFLTWAVDKGYGGLEHRNSTLLLCNRFDLPNPLAPGQQTDDYITLLGLCSHEYFHTWWVKRARPKALLHYQLNAEQYTDQLWLYEGFTSYFDDYALVKTGLITVEKYLQLLSETISRVTRASSQMHQSLAASSHNAWTMYYKQDENAQNAVVNYYAKGSLVALCLDAQLQQQGLSLTGFMQACWHAYGRTELGSDWDTLAAILLKYSQNPALVQELWHWVYQSGSLPLEHAIQTLGLSLCWRAAINQQDVSGNKTFVVEPRAFGAWYEFKTDGMAVSAVAEQSPAKQAGIMAGDLIIAVDGLRMTEQNWREVNLRKARDATIELHLFRQQRLLTVTLQPAPAASTVAILTADPAQAPSLQRWLGIGA